MQILGICGSLRKGSLNMVALRACSELMPQGMSLRITTIADLPLFNQDVFDAGVPEPAKRLRAEIAEADGVLIAARNSLVIALAAAAASTVLGTMAGFALHRYRPRLLPVLVLATIAIPEILMGVSLLIFFVLLNVTLGMASIILAHTTFCIGFVALVVRARLAGMDESLTEAARDLGATPAQAFRWVTLPLIMPGIVAGALMAFTLSLDDFVITFFTAGAGSATLPLQIYTMVKIAVTPEVNAVSTLLMLLTLTLILVATRLSPSILQTENRR